MKCCVKNCFNNKKQLSKTDGITFHPFPKDPELRSSWLKALNLTNWEPKDRSAVCTDHFRNEDIYVTGSGTRKIRSDAIPIVSQDSAEDLKAPAALSVCRICLAMDTRMHDIRDHGLEQLYEEITGIFFGMEEKLPQRVCYECAHRLHSAASFRNKALRSHSLLADMLLAYTCITIKDIKSINRSQHRLKSKLMLKEFTPNKFDLEINEVDELKNEILEENGPSKDIDGYNKDGYNSDVSDAYIIDPRYINEGKDISIKDGYNSEVSDQFIIDPRYMNEGKDIRINDGYNDDGNLLEVKSEENQVYLEEYLTDFESDDDKKLSLFVDQEKKKVKVKRKRNLQVKGGKRVETKKRRCPEDTPANIMDQYKVTGVKRRAHEGLDENLFVISTISYEEQRAEVEKRQETNAYKHAAYKCNLCFRGFQVQERYEVHAVRHSEQCGAYECFICKSRMKTAKALRKHLTGQHTEKFTCKACPFTTMNRGVAKEHEKWHSGAKYKCPHCPSEFEKITSYMGHLRIKHPTNFVCSLCGYTFVSPKGIEVHKKRKHRLDEDAELVGPYCDVCDMKFLSDEAYNRHLKLTASHRNVNDPDKIRNDSQSTVPKSDKRLSGRRSVKRQPVIKIPNVEDTPYKPVTCEQCGVQLRNLRFYAQHFRREHPDKNRTKYPISKTMCMCEHCGRIYHSMATLNAHMWVHTGVKRFKCSLCPKSFSQKGNLLSHGRAHAAARPSFPCPLCGKHFAFYNNRRRHMFIHTGLKPFKCETCNKCFTTAGELRAHVDHVHLKKPWPRRARRHNAHGHDNTE